MAISKDPSLTELAEQRDQLNETSEQILRCANHREARDPCK
jgi:hypothetical protein